MKTAMFDTQDAAVELVPELPPPGQITSRSELPEIGATELVLSNGMRVTVLNLTPVSQSP
jgi:hypothetical protein